MLYVDKHRPRSYEALDFHPDLTTQLKRLGTDFPHLLFYGPSGAGKRTRIACLLRLVYGAGAEKVCARAHRVYAALTAHHRSRWSTDASSCPAAR